METITEYSYKQLYNKYYTAIQEALPSYFISDNLPQQRVLDAMEYSLTVGGKRLRGILLLAFCEIFYADWRRALPYACAVEMVHTYSLIHDDLPCMDNDVLRRGKPTCHIQFDEATAVLAGDALLTYAFEIIVSQQDLPPQVNCDVIKELSKAIGANGMVGGQMMDLINEDRIDLTLDEIKDTHNLKTAKLINAAIIIGCLVGGANEQYLEIARKYGSLLGLTFQIVDDILDETATEQELGKPIGSDSTNCKSTYTTILGLKQSQSTVEKLLQQTKDTINGTKLDNQFLIDLAIQMAQRTN